MTVPFLFWRIRKGATWNFYPDPSLATRGPSIPRLSLEFSPEEESSIIDPSLRYFHVVSALGHLIDFEGDGASMILNSSKGWTVFDMMRFGGVELRDADTKEVLWQKVGI